MSNKYTMRISRLTVDKLGVKLYDKVSAVVAELVANAYDADATKVIVTAPMGQYLCTKRDNTLVDKNYNIKVEDDGVGMTPEEMNEFYLKVGAERRNDSRRGEISKIHGRKVMGRKGVGKLAPFGICNRIEIITSGGDFKQEGDQEGYLTAHLILDRDKVLEDTDTDYNPEIGELDGKLQARKGTSIIMKSFTYRQVPEISLFARQLSQRFGFSTSNWQIDLVDSEKTNSDLEHSKTVSQFDVAKMENTEIRFVKEKTPVTNKEDYKAYFPDGKIRSEIKAGFDYENKFYGIEGWVAYSKHAYGDDLMAGVRIYCRGKIAAQTVVFNMGAGITGEHDIRSYLIGEIHADWLDEKEDLIQTDRRDILWSHELGQEFEKWGQQVVRTIGRISRDPIRKKTWAEFQSVSNLQEKIKQAFPEKEQEPIREKAREFTKIIGQRIRPEELKDQQYVDSLAQLGLMLAPHITLNEKLKEAAESIKTPIGIVAEILKMARIAELSSFGLIAEDRIKVIDKLEDLVTDHTVSEADLQRFIENAPWLINPQWSPVTYNQSFSTVKRAFQEYYKKMKGVDIILDISDSSKRPDFVLSNQDNRIEIIEIKVPGHRLTNEEAIRIDNYSQVMRKFFDEQGNKDFLKLFNNYRITLVCDHIQLDGIHETAYRYLESTVLTHITWDVFLLNTKRMHQEFLKEADRQKKYAASRN